jgi:hypothetical protein
VLPRPPHKRYAEKSTPESMMKLQTLAALAAGVDGANTMRSALALALLMTLCASASTATVNHSRTYHHVTASHSQGVTSGFAVPSWAYAAPRPPVDGGGFGGGGHMGGFGVGAHVSGIDVGVRVGGLAVGGMGRFGASYMSLGDHSVHYHTMHGFGRYWSGYSLYAYDPDCNDFFFRHPDYQWQPSCS